MTEAWRGVTDFEPGQPKIERLTQQYRDTLKRAAFTFFCSIPEHTPYMWGQLVILPDSSAPQS